ncbi:unnamed protein product [Camellia sinensis]
MKLTKWEEMQGVVSGGSEQKILVLVRLRPLSEKEIARNEVSDWECINETTILFRNSLQEQSMFPTAHTFDGVFSGDCLTRQVYEQGTKEIALSVGSGIFAYGQTSSGKTYTMIGITEYTVAGIYDYIHNDPEVVRDLLSADSLPLRVVDDPEHHIKMGPLLGVSTMKQLDFLLMTIPWCYKISTETYLISISLVDQAKSFEWVQD